MMIIDPKELKYSIRQRYLAQCAKKGARPAFAFFYVDVAALCGSSPRKIQRLMLAKRAEVVTATTEEINAFAQVLECAPSTLTAEAAERVVAG